MLDNGNAVNFVHGAVNGPYIYSVQGGLILSAISLVKDIGKQSVLAEPEVLQLKELSTKDMQFIAEKWLNCFDQCDSHIDFHAGIYFLDLRMGFDQGQQIGTVFEYLENNGYFKCEELKEIMDILVKKILPPSLWSPQIDYLLSAPSKLNIKQDAEILANLGKDLDRVSKIIKDFLDNGMFASLNGYITDLLIKFIDNKIPTDLATFKEIKMNLYLLRSTADLFLSANFKESCGHARKEVLKGSFDKVFLLVNNTSIIFTTFSNIVDSFKKEGVKLDREIECIIDKILEKVNSATKRKEERKEECLPLVR